MKIKNSINLSNFYEKIITLVGSVVVISVLSITVSLFVVALPLFFSSNSKFNNSISIENEDIQKIQPQILQVLIDPNRVVILNNYGQQSIFDSQNGTLLNSELNTESAKQITRQKISKNNVKYEYFNDNSIVATKFDYVGNEYLIESSSEFKLEESRNNPLNIILKKPSNTKELIALNINDEGEGSSIKYTKLDSGNANKSISNFDSKILDAKYIFFTKRNRYFYVVGETGLVEYWKNIEKPQLIARNNITKSKITSASLIYGELSLAIATEDNKLIIIDPHLQSNSITIRNIIDIEEGKKYIQIKPANNNRSIIAKTDSEHLDIIYSTTGKFIHSIPIKKGLVDYQTDEYNEFLYLLYDSNLVEVYKLEIFHPEAGFKTFFSKITYESYHKPTYTWQSSASNDDFEPKLSLVPLIIGSFKGTIYAMIFVIPISIFAAVYLSQFAKTRTRKIIKPAIEMMSSIPSVVVGFLAALWLGPQLEKYFLHIIIFLTLLPISITFGYIFWNIINNFFPKKVTTENIYIIASITLILTAISANIVEGLISNHTQFNIIEWLYVAFDIRYEQQNAIVTAIALSFASIPIVFTLTDDAIKTVPATFRAASLAMGATNWQTITKVLLPAASPGIFAAIILGVARSIGETMIVLMASGNTPITDWSLFSGMRTLSANIAVEISEAPVDGTLYRTLFFSGLMLFVITFFLNFSAELIRSRLQKKYLRH